MGSWASVSPLWPSGEFSPLWMPSWSRGCWTSLSSPFISTGMGAGEGCPHTAVLSSSGKHPHPGPQRKPLAQSRVHTLLPGSHPAPNYTGTLLRTLILKQGRKLPEATATTAVDNAPRFQIKHMIPFPTQLNTPSPSLPAYNPWRPLTRGQELPLPLEVPPQPYTNPALKGASSVPSNTQGLSPAAARPVSTPALPCPQTPRGSNLREERLTHTPLPWLEPEAHPHGHSQGTGSATDHTLSPQGPRGT